ncbi:uncharacterized protein ISCGN_016089 [Ixodes scapularis]
MARVANLCDTVTQRLLLTDPGLQGRGPRPQVPVPTYTGYDDRKSVADFLAELAAYKLAAGASDEYVLARVLPVALQASAARWWRIVAPEVPGGSTKKRKHSTTSDAPALEASEEEGASVAKEKKKKKKKKKDSQDSDQELEPAKSVSAWQKAAGLGTDPAGEGVVSGWGTCESRCFVSGATTDPEPCGFARPRLAVRGFPVSGEKGILVAESNRSSEGLTPYTSQREEEAMEVSLDPTEPPPPAKKGTKSAPENGDQKKKKPRVTGPTNAS